MYLSPRPNAFWYLLMSSIFATYGLSIALYVFLDFSEAPNLFLEGMGRWTSLLGRLHSSRLGLNISCHLRLSERNLKQHYFILLLVASLVTFFFLLSFFKYFKPYALWKYLVFPS